MLNSNKTMWYMEKKDLPSNNEKISICDIMKGNTSEIIQKLECQILSFVQNYSDLYTAYLHMFDDIFGTCYIAEKEYFDKLQIDPKVLKQLKEHTETLKQNSIESIEMFTKFFDAYAKMRISAVKSFDNYIHVMMDSYAKMLSNLNDSSISK
jgi:hypothetical protein